jgi:hypothetical protein
LSVRKLIATTYLSNTGNPLKQRASTHEFHGGTKLIS